MGDTINNTPIQKQNSFEEIRWYVNIHWYGDGNGLKKSNGNRYFAPILLSLYASNLKWVSSQGAKMFKYNY